MLTMLSKVLIEREHAYRYDTPFPLAHEKIYVPDAYKVFAAIRRAISY